MPETGEGKGVNRSSEKRGHKNETEIPLVQHPSVTSITNAVLESAQFQAGGVMPDLYIWFTFAALYHVHI